MSKISVEFVFLQFCISAPNPQNNFSYSHNFHSYKMVLRQSLNCLASALWTNFFAVLL